MDTIERTDGRALYTTSEMIRMEREIVGHMQRGNQRGYDDPMLVSPQLRIWTEDRHPELNRSQRQAVDEIFLSREKIVGLDGVAGAGKTFAMYAGAVICLGGLIFAGIRMMSGRFQDAIPGLFGALFGAGVLGWGAGWIGPDSRRCTPDGGSTGIQSLAGFGRPNLLD